MKKQGDEIGQRVGRTDARVEGVGTRVGTLERSLGATDGRVESVGGRVATLEKTVGDVGDSARAAGQRADAANQRAEGVDGRLTGLWGKRHARDVVEHVEVLFAFDRWDLSDLAQTALLPIVNEMRQNPKLTVDLEGYTDPTGRRDYNVQLSQRRVEAVRRYLVERGVDLPRVYFVGLGPITDSGTANEQKRRVSVKLLRYPD